MLLDRAVSSTTTITRAVLSSLIENNDVCLEDFTSPFLFSLLLAYLLSPVLCAEQLFQRNSL